MESAVRSWLVSESTAETRVPGDIDGTVSAVAAAGVALSALGL